METGRNDGIGPFQENSFNQVSTCALRHPVPLPPCGRHNRSVGMRYLRYPAVKVSLLVWALLVPLAVLADRSSFEGSHPPVGPWLLLVLMAGPLLLSAALSLAVLRLPAVAPARDRSWRTR